MGLNLRERKMVTSEIAKRYQKVNKKEKGNILNEFCSLTGYVRSYACHILKNLGRKIYLRRNGRQIIYIAGDVKKVKRNKPKIYTDKVISALKRIWYIFDCICGKRLAPILAEIVPILEAHKEIELDTLTKEALLKISASTIDRALKEEKKKFRLKSKSRTKPGSILKHQIPIRTFSDWNEAIAGFVEVDLVSHDGGYAKGDFIQTLDLTDIATTWTETIAVKNKAQIWVFNALKDVITNRLPFKILGIDSDNGAEFINSHLLAFCNEHEITFTRTRPYRKNDNCYVEQKNYSIVRRYVGYYRYETEEELNILNKLYKVLRVYTNFFLPTMKLVSKTRMGAKVTRKYDKPKTPYQRVVESSSIDIQNKHNLKVFYKNLNPACLKREVEVLKTKLISIAKKKKDILLFGNEEKLMVRKEFTFH